MNDGKKRKIAKIEEARDRYFKEAEKQRDLDYLFERIICEQDPSEKSFLQEMYRDRSRSL